MTSSLVGSEMCIRDRPIIEGNCKEDFLAEQAKHLLAGPEGRRVAEFRDCLLYTSDAADDM
eukprot:8676516-Prorocentrum_lima.AAC.1